MSGVSRVFVLLLLIVLTALNVDARGRSSSHSSHSHSSHSSHSSHPSHSSHTSHVSHPSPTSHSSHVIQPSHTSHTNHGSASNHINSGLNHHSSNSELSGSSHHSHLSGSGQSTNHAHSGNHAYPSSNKNSGKSEIHTYPSNGGLSGNTDGSLNAKHTYPSTSGTSESHSYPTNGGLSGNGDTSSGPKHAGTSNSHSYPSNGGLSGTGQTNSGGPLATKNIYSNTNENPGTHSNTLNGLATSGSSHTYPSNSPGSLSGSAPSNSASTSRFHNYPAPNGLSGSKKSKYTGKTPKYPQNQPVLPHVTEKPRVKNQDYWEPHEPIKHLSDNRVTVNHHDYHYVHEYRPPSTPIVYISNGGRPISYPVYREVPPVYVYEYRDSNSRYRNLLAGLSLYNLGRLSQNNHAYNYYKHYMPRQHEYCKFGVFYDNGNNEEMKIDCQIMANFIWEEENAKNNNQMPTNQYPIVQVVNTTVTVVSNQTILPNGTLVSSNSTSTAIAKGQANPSMLPNGAIDSSNVNSALTYPTLATNGMMMLPNGTLVPVPAQDGFDPRFKGNPVQITTNMRCYVARTTMTSSMHKSIPCGLLQTYSEQSFHKNSAFRLQLSMHVIGIVFTAFTLCFY